MRTRAAIFTGIMLISMVLLMFLPSAQAETYSPTETIILNSWIGDIEIDPARPLAYLSARDTNTIIVVSLTNLSIENNITVGSQPYRMAIDPLTDRLYVALSSSPGVAVINLSSQSLEETWSLDEDASDVAVGRPGRLYVTTYDYWGYPQIIDTSNGSVVGEITDAGLIYRGAILDISQDKENLYVGACGSSPASLYKFDVTTDNPTLEVEDDHGSIGSNLQDMALSPDGNLIYLACGAPYYIQALDTIDFSADGSFYTGAYPSSVAVSGNGSIVLGARSSSSDFSFKSYDSESHSEIDIFQASEEVLRVRMDAVGQYILAFTGDTYYDNYFLDIYWNIYQGPPKANIISPLPDSGCSSIDVPIEIEFYDPDGVDQATLSITLDGVPLSTDWNVNNSTLSAMASGLGIGGHTVIAEASDMLGYGPNIASWSFIVDTEPPNSYVENLPQFITDPYLTVNAIPSDDQGVATVEIYQRYDNGNWTHVFTRTTPPWSFTFFGLSEGIYEFYSIAEDRAGNREETPTTADTQTCVDLSHPDVEIIEPSTLEWICESNITVRWNASDTASGISYQWLSLDMEPAINLSSNVTEFIITNVSEGYHTIILQVTDEAGYTNYDWTDIRTDNTPPRIHITSPLGHPLLESGPVIVSWVGVENGSGIAQYTISVNNETEIPLGYETSVAFSTLEDGDYTFCVRAYDKAGNIAEKVVKTTINSSVHSYLPIQPESPAQSEPQDSSDIGWVVILMAILIFFNVILVVILLNKLVKSPGSSQLSADQSPPPPEDHRQNYPPPPPPPGQHQHPPPPPPPE